MAEGYWIDPDREMAVIAEADRRRREVARIQREQLTPERVGELTGALANNPNLSAALLQSLLTSGTPVEQAQPLIEQDDGGGPIGSLFDIGGDVLNAVTSGVDSAWDTSWEQVIKPAVRGAIGIADSMSQEAVQRPLTAWMAYAQGEADSVRQAYNEYGDSPFVNYLQGDTPGMTEEQGSLGHGLLPGGAAAEEHVRERTLTIRGATGDIGQAIANGVVGSWYQPGDYAYDTVAGYAGFAAEVAGDPLAWGTGGLAKLRRAGRALDSSTAIDVMRRTGAIAGERRNTVLLEEARNFFGNEKVLQRLADSDAYDIMQVWSSSPANRLDVGLVNRLGAARDQASVAEVLFDAVARGHVSERGFYSGVGNFVKRNLVDSTSRLTGPLRYFTREGRLSGLSPNGFVSADNIGEASLKVDSLLRQANVGRDVRAGIFDRMSAVGPGRFDELFDVVTDAVDEVRASTGVHDSLNGVARNYKNQIDDLRQYGVDSWGDPINAPYAKSKIIQNFDGEELEVVLPTPQISTELNNLALHLPDAQTIRRAATENSLLRRVYQSKGWDFTESTTRTLTNKVFKPLALLRPAYVVRIAAEEQARLTAAGFDSVMNHPFRYIMANVVNRGAFTDLTGDSLTDVARQLDVITKDATAVLGDVTGSRGRIFAIARRSPDTELTENFARGWRGELGQLSVAPETRKLTELRGDIDAFRDWAQTDGLESITRLSKTNDEAASLLDFGRDFDDWADGLRSRIEAKTAGWDEDLVDAVVNQKVPLPGAAVGATDDAAFANMLRGKARQGRAPAAVKFEHIPEGRTRHLDNAVGHLFDLITGKPTSYLARYPVFRQRMLQRTGDLFDSLADDALRQDAFARAVNNLGADVGGVVRETPELTRLRSQLDNSLGKPGGPIESINDLNEVVKVRASEDVKDLLFDMTNRSAAQDVLTAVVPFLDAYKEVTRTWTRLLQENPGFFFRAQAGYRELQEQGRFYVNEYGDEVFLMPGGGPLSAFTRRLNEAGGDLTDIPFAAAGAVTDTVTGNTPDYGIAMEGRVQGLNLVAQGVGPGFGPVVQIPAGLMSSPDLDQLREFIAPFGSGFSEAGELADPGTIAQSLMPAWMKKVFNGVSSGAINQRQWNSTVGDAMKVLAETGDYDDPRDLVEEAERLGRWALLARGFGQATAPTGPSATFEVDLSETIPQDAEKLPDWDPEKDPNGTMFSVGALAQDYYRLLSVYGPEQAAARFFQMYGIEPFFVAQAKSRSIREAPVTTEGDRWMRRNVEIADDYRNVAGFFAPTDEEAELDFTVYNRQFSSGDRQSLTPEQMADEAIKVRARAMYDNVRQLTEALPAAQRDRAREIAKARLESQFPGWQSPTPGLAARVDLPTQVRELEQAVADPRLADEPLTAPLSTYLTLRQQAFSIAEQAGYAGLGSQAMTNVRETLHAAGTQIASRYTSFSGVWSQVLSREVQ